MSLLLRKMNQTTLDDANLGDYHAEINANKHLAIVGACGKPLFTINGIAFSKSAPTKVEMEYASELLQEFLLSHKQAIKKFFAAQTALGHLDSDILKLSTPLPRGQKNKPIHMITTAGGFTGTYSGGELGTLSFSMPEGKFAYSVTNTEVPNIGKLAKDKAVIKQLKETVCEYAKYHETSRALNTARAALSSCNI